MIGLSLCVDCGGSATKIVYQLEEEDSPKYLLMSPEVEQVPASQLQKYFDRLLWRGDPAPNQEAWLQVDGKTFVVGEFAQYFDPSDRLHEVKYENALYKVLTAIGVIAQKSGLNTRKKLGVRLAMLLPWEEYADKDRFSDKLSELLTQLVFRGEKIKVKLEEFLCRPEGGGW